tara:strand:+ start:1322 stop:1810 length:489 start_codon:yes stop_codon:yes gene_type:complete
MSSNREITQTDIDQAQESWANGLIAIGKAHVDGGDAKAIAAELLRDLYGFQTGDGVVLFKPTKASHVPFRSTFESALSYFVGGEDGIAEDQGFALQPWIKIEFLNHKILYHDTLALAMGHYIFHSLQGDEVKVEYTFGYIKDHDDQLKIILQHSSLPYSIDS